MKLRFLSDVTVTTAGTRVQISNQDLSVKTIIFQADPTNPSTTRLYIGSDDVTATKGITLLPGGSFVVSVKELSTNNDTVNLKDFWVDASSNGAKLKVAYVTRFS